MFKGSEREFIRYMLYVMLLSTPPLTHFQNKDFFIIYIFSSHTRQLLVRYRICIKLGMENFTYIDSCSPRMCCVCT